MALQIKHRISVDFDFYNQNEFDSERILTGFQKKCKKATLIQKAINTLITKIDGIEVSLFTYPYKLLNPLIETDYVNLASINDIAAMKLIAIIQRGIQRDFIDLHFLIRHLGLINIFQLTEKKYPPFNKYAGLQAITYFADAEKVPLDRKIVLFEPLAWDEIKKFITIQAKEFKNTLEK